MMMMIPRVLKRSRPYSGWVDTKLPDLPRDILVDIILRLPLKSICSLQCASKMLNKVVDKDFVAQWRLHNAIPTGHQVPHLMILARSYNGKNKETKTFHPLQYGSNFLEMREYSSEIIVSQKYNYQVHCIFSNLICFKDVSYGGPSFLLDPPKRQVLELPASKVPASIGRLRGLLEWLAMGFDDTTGTLKILRVSGSSRYKNLVAQVLELGTSSWREIAAVPPCNLSHKNVSANGDMHWWITRKPRTREESKIVSFDFKKEEFYRTPHPTLRSEGSRLSDSNSVNLRGCLAIVDVVVVNLTIIDIWVLKNYEERTWEREYCFEFDISLEKIIGSCGVWEHGIYFKDAIGTGAQNRPTAMFLDLRGVSTGGVRMKVGTCLLQNWTINSYYTESLISLKHYGNLVKPEASDEYPEGAWFL